MGAKVRGHGVRVRRFRPEDQPEVFALLADTFGKSIDPARFRRISHSNPDGPAIRYVAEAEGHVVAYRGFLPGLLRVGGREYRALQGSQAATVPAYRGRGLFTALGGEVIGAYFEAGGDLVYSFPSPQAFAASTGRLKFELAGRRRHWVRPLRPWAIRHGFAARVGTWMHGRSLRSPSGITSSPADADRWATLRHVGTGFACTSEKILWHLNAFGRRYRELAWGEGALLLGEARRKGLRAATVVASDCCDARETVQLLRGAAEIAASEGYDLLFSWPIASPVTMLRGGMVPLGSSTPFIVRTRESDLAQRIRRERVHWVRLLDTDAY